MIKISFFVEGQTERIFIEKLLDKYFTHPEFEIESCRLIGDGIQMVRKRNIYSGIQLYILIYDVGNDERVVSELLERSEYMISKQGYNMLLALKDLYPKTIQEKSKVITSIQRLFNKYKYKDKLKFILAIMETEAWFLAEFNLFSRINSRLTHTYINEKSNYDLVNDDPESYSHPAKIVDKIYRLVDLRYKKREEQSYKIAHNIDYDFLCLDVKEMGKISSFFYFLECINEAVSP